MKIVATKGRKDRKEKYSLSCSMRSFAAINSQPAMECLKSFELENTEMSNSSFPSPLPLGSPVKKIRHCRALTVLEMLVSVTLLVFIVVGLTAMFVQTQRAFKAGLKQSTMTDAGHTIIDMVAADLAQASDAQNPYVVNLYWGWATMNTSIEYQDTRVNVYRTNQLQEIFALVHTNTQWVGVGYAVSNYATGAGTLYRYVALTNDPLNTNVLFDIFYNDVLSQSFDPRYFHRLTDGVVHLKIRAFDQFGNETPIEQGRDYGLTNTSFTYPVPGYTNNLLLYVPPSGLPASIQLEVGVLEPEAFEQLRALPGGQVQSNYLGKAGGKIQIYRQNIPIAGAIR